MSDTETRIAIATAMGWTDINFYEDNAGPGFWNGYPPVTIGVDPHGEWTANKEKHHKPLPNYPTSRDACAEFEATLSPLEQNRYMCAFENILVRDGAANLWSWALTTTTPRQRCEAFLRVKGLWKEGAR